MRWASAASAPSSLLSIAVALASRSAILSCFFCSCRSLSKAAPTTCSREMPNARLNFSFSCSFAYACACVSATFSLSRVGASRSCISFALNFSLISLTLLSISSSSKPSSSRAMRNSVSLTSIFLFCSCSRISLFAFFTFGGPSLSGSYLATCCFGRKVPKFLCTYPFVPVPLAVFKPTPLYMLENEAVEIR